MTWFSGAVRNAHRLSNSIGVFRNIWWLLVGVVGGGAALVWRLSRVGGWPVTVGVGLAVLGIVTFTVGVALIRRASVAPYTCESAEYVYQFDRDDPRRQAQVTRIRIRANRDDVVLFSSSYYWTGHGRSDLRVLNGHEIVARGMAMDSERRYYYVRLEQPLNRGETDVIEIRQELFDEERKFQPVLAKSVNEPVGKLTLKVIYPAGLEPRKVLARELVRSRNSDFGWRPVREKPVDLQGTGDTSEAIYEIGRPRVGRRYDLYWKPWSNYFKTP